MTKHNLVAPRRKKNSHNAKVKGPVKGMTRRRRGRKFKLSIPPKETWSHLFFSTRNDVTLFNGSARTISVTNGNKFEKGKISVFILMNNTTKTLTVSKGTRLPELKSIIEKLLGADKSMEGLRILKNGKDVDTGAMVGKDIEHEDTLTLSMSGKGGMKRKAPVTGNVCN